MGKLYTTITVSKQVYNELSDLKEKLGKKSWDELMQYLLDLNKKFRELNLVKVMCNDLREATASLPGWWKILRQSLVDEELATEALSYLKQKEGEPDIFVVDREKCKQ
ncbi:hypothetical protein [Desulfurococcus amylolyticus]|uniref:hypothetical protein n=1 Tax=Desulfurococcus amylolyticus TaxID=94694 RepID=UPI0023F4493B|nr:hypothetical protein [Desulfurococcus amylolyticus]